MLNHGLEWWFQILRQPKSGFWSFTVQIGGTKIHLPDTVENIRWKFSEYATVIINAPTCYTSSEHHDT